MQRSWLTFFLSVTLFLGLIASQKQAPFFAQKLVHTTAQQFQTWIPRQKQTSQTNEQVLGVQKSNVPTQKTSQIEKRTLYNLINAHRKEQSLSPLNPHPLLEDSASRKLADMQTNNYFQHADKNQNESWYLFTQAGYSYSVAGENLATGYNTPWSIFAAWKESPEHNAQLLKPGYTDIGIASECRVKPIQQLDCLTVLHLGAK